VSVIPLAGQIFTGQIFTGQIFTGQLFSELVRSGDWSVIYRSAINWSDKHLTTGKICNETLSLLFN
jgi:hypothetical protein